MIITDVSFRNFALAKCPESRKWKDNTVRNPGSPPEFTLDLIGGGDDKPRIVMLNSFQHLRAATFDLNNMIYTQHTRIPKQVRDDILIRYY